MNEIVNKFLPAGDTFMPEIHLKQHGFTYDACGPFTKNKKRIEKFMRIGNTDYIYKNDLDKAGSEHYLVYGKYKGLSKRTKSDKILKNWNWNFKTFEIASNPKYNGYQGRLA